MKIRSSSIRKPRKPCKKSQSRSRSTGYCRRKPCKSSQKRDPITNRCRRKSCKPGKTRDVSTKRCRIKKSPKLKSDPKVEKDLEAHLSHVKKLMELETVLPNYRLRSKSDGSDYGMGVSTVEHKSTQIGNDLKE